MHDDSQLTDDRLTRLLRERIRPAVYSDSQPLTVHAWHPSSEPSVKEALKADYYPSKVGARWGRPWGTTWFRFHGRIPPKWAGKCVEALFDLGFDDKQPGFSAEGLVYRADGTAVKGLHPFNQWVRIANTAIADNEITLYVEAAANPHIRGPISWLGDPETAEPSPLYRLARAELALFHKPVWDLVQDFEVLYQLMQELPNDQPRHHEIRVVIARALDAIDLGNIEGTAQQARTILAQALDVSAHASAHRLSAVGHAHIDSAWLWPRREAIRKVARTTANAINLMDRYPRFVFVMSQAQQFSWLSEHRPELFARVKQKIAADQFIPVGGMWVESDTNLPGSEALARQLSYGKRYFLKEFGIDTPEVWLPDSFGYSAALPQLVKLSGSSWFLTQKISWSQTNKFPHHSFWWEGIDGSRIFTHFPPVDTYNSELSGKEVAHAVRNYRDKGHGSRSLIPFGWGNGGGGPTREMLERASRLADLDGSARVTIEKPSTFFAAASNEYREAPVWYGELYLEYHRGTYTSQAAMKRGNRRCEHLLREAELWATTAHIYAGESYPYDELEQLWKTVLFQQFHDILPGSSIAWVHREATDTYTRVEQDLLALISSTQLKLAGPGTRSVVFNAAPFSQNGVPAGAATVTPVMNEPNVVMDSHDEGWTLSNGYVSAVVDKRGLISSIRDMKTDREVIPSGENANLLQLHPDLPNRWDAWDIDEFYRNSVTNLLTIDSITVDKEDPEVSILRIKRSFRQSSLIQLVSLSRGSQRLDIETIVDWHETETLLKAAFPIMVRADVSSAQIQFGYVQRPTHRNTSWDTAKFEICAHRFLHVGEPGWGCAIINDSIYGHDVTRDVTSDGSTITTVRLSLLRAPRYPDPQTDQGSHTFRYAIVPGTDILGATREGYALNLPLRKVTGSQDVNPLVTSSNASVVIESIKLADDQSGDIVVRLYEAQGGQCRTAVSFGVDIKRAWITDLLERESTHQDLPIKDNTVQLSLRPFQIITLRGRRSTS